MANKRMFSLSIVDTDAFLDMPSSSRLLYYDLAMRADDEGFVANPKKITRESGAGEDAFKVLIAKKFIIPFESGVCVIKHWLIHNTIRMDRFHGTTHIEEKSQLIIKDNKAYKLVEIGPGMQSGNQLATRLPQSNLIQSNLSKIPAKLDSPFSLKEEIQKLYDNPRRDLNLIGLYFEYRKPDLQTRDQYEKALKRHLKAAKDLVPFTDDQIIKAMDYAKKEYKDIYTLETVIKILTK